MALTSFNRDDCVCGIDHDSIEHITTKLIGLNFRGQVSRDQIPDLLQQFATQVGWVNEADSTLSGIAVTAILQHLAGQLPAPEMPKAIQAQAYRDGWTHPVVHPSVGE